MFLLLPFLQILIEIDMVEKCPGFVVWVHVPSGLLQCAPLPSIRVFQFE